MIYIVIDTFYLMDEQLRDSPSLKDGIDEATETALRVYGGDLIQESGILLRLPQAVMATAQVLFHRFYCKKSFVRFSAKSEVVACGVVYAASRRRGISLLEDPPWWTVFDADEAGIQEVCRVLAHLNSLPKSQCIPVYRDSDSFTIRRTPDPQASKESPASAVASDKGTPIPLSASQEKDSVTKAALNKAKEKSDDEGKPLPAELNGKQDPTVNLESGFDRSWERERERSRGCGRDDRRRDSDHNSRGRDSNRERDMRRRSRKRSSGHLDKEKSKGASHHETGGLLQFTLIS